ncbi:MAG: DUF4476 domain-containing protein [Chitinophagaceae bacterium]
MKGKIIGFFIAVLLINCMALMAQPIHFLYIQAEPKQAFQVKYQEQNFPSTSQGYLVIPKLPKAVTTLSIIPPQEEKAIVFYVDIQTDEGYALTKKANNQWVLFNYHTLQVIEPGVPIALNNSNNTVKNVPIEKPVTETKAIPEKTEDITIPVVVVKDSLAVQNKKNNISQVTKIVQIQNDDEFIQVFEDVWNSTKDTVDIKIATAPSILTNFKDTTAAKKCNIASEEEFLKLRLQMAAAPDENKMLSISVKHFAQLCFSTEQIRNLSHMFLKDETKFSFLISAKPAIYDSNNFPSLGNLLQTPQYIQQFKNILP